MALAHMLYAQGLQGQVAWAHFNHRWNAAEDEAETFLTQQAKAYGAKLHIQRGSGPLGRRPASNAEAKARAERYVYFQQLCTEHVYAGVLLAHTQTDIAETFLMRAGKGSGVAGLSAMPSQATMNGLTLLRPLLAYTREELRAYLQAHKQPWLEDPDNLNGNSQRARIRALLPALERAGVPVHGLAATALRCQRTAAYMNSVTQNLMHENQSSFAYEQFVMLHDELALHFLKSVTESQTGAMAPRTSKREALLAKIRATPSGKATLGGVLWRWGRGTLHFSLE